MAANKNNLKIKPSKDFWRDSDVGRQRKLWEEIKKNYGNVIRTVAIVDFIVSYLIVGIIRDWSNGLFDETYQRNILNIFVLGLHPAILIPFLIIAFIAFYIAGKIYNPNTYNEEIGAYQIRVKPVLVPV